MNRARDEEEAIGAEELHHPSVSVEVEEAPPPAPVVPTVQVDVQQTQTRPDRVEGLNKRAGLLVTILTALTLLGGGVKAVSDVNAHFATVDTKIEANSHRLDRQSDKYEKLQGQQGDDEKTERSHFDEILRHVVGTETDVKWIIKHLK